MLKVKHLKIHLGSTSLENFIIKQVNRNWGKSFHTYKSEVTYRYFEVFPFTDSIQEN